MQWVVNLGGDDIEDGVPDREQVDCEREKVEVGEKQERDKHEETTNARSNISHDGWYVDGTNAHRDTLSQMWCDHMCKVHEKKTCVVYLSTPPVGYSGSVSTINETNCNKNKINLKILMSSFPIPVPPRCA